MAFYGLEPWGTGADDLRAGVVAATIANVNRDPAKTDPFHAEDFVPQREPRATQSIEDQAQVLDAWAKAMERKR